MRNYSNDVIKHRLTVYFTRIICLPVSASSSVSQCCSGLGEIFILINDHCAFVVLRSLSFLISKVTLRSK